MCRLWHCRGGRLGVRLRSSAWPGWPCSLLMRLGVGRPEDTQHPAPPAGARPPRARPMRAQRCTSGMIAERSPMHWCRRGWLHRRGSRQWGDCGLDELPSSPARPGWPRSLLMRLGAGRPEGTQRPAPPAGARPPRARPLSTQSHEPGVAPRRGPLTWNGRVWLQGRVDESTTAQW